METHPQKAEDMPLGDGDVSTLVRTIDPILDQLYDGAIKGALHADDLVDIATRIRTILHAAAARQSTVRAAAGPVGNVPSHATAAGG
jgi:hypothetical protein